ncbi:HD domain-containing phosphohydrolase [Petrocella sp. FN5]|uniref:HD domain-containing phosphohydrolase n=1 Tax=Petrocella sp. FN5 TaxID=3032002 RepID=UPI0023DACFC8|nr:HD domain-containing phosphohydrolase [Petrocella sp. FN5]MDF1616299.1 diguanylate cyclase [Petrocella sp. FN5]
MKSFIKNYYSIGIIMAAIIGLTMWIQYNNYIESIKMEVENTIDSRLDYMASEINGHIQRNQKALEAVESFILIEKDEEKIIDFMQALMTSNPTFQSIYFGTPENKMINGSGFIPPATFDLLARPWYIAALNENKHIITRPYLNASKDKWIVTLAKPVYDHQNRLLGVVAGDSLLESTLNLLEEQKISDESYTFLLDNDRNVLLHPDYENMTDLTLSLGDLSVDLLTELSKNKNGIILTSLDGVIGYVGWRTFDDSGWVIGGFAPMSDFVNQRLQNMTIFLITALSTTIILFVVFILQKKYVINPISELDEDIQKISVDKNVTYRLPIKPGDPFSDLRTTTNKVLEKTEDYFKTMNKNQKALKNANKDLYATLQQLTAVEEELRSQNDELVENKQALEVSERKNRAIIEVLPDIIFILNEEGIFLDCLVNQEDMLYTKKEHFMNKALSEIMPESIVVIGMRAIHQAMNTGQLQRFEYALEIEGKQHYYEMRMIKFMDQGVLSIVRDITEQKQDQIRIEKLSYHDQLTDLYNRRFYEEEQRRLDVPRNLPLSVMMLDVNGLKLTNDAFGHLVGDQLLLHVAKVIKDHCRLDDIIARIGGDEFIVLLPKTDTREAKRIADRIRKGALEQKMDNVVISVSIGCATKTIEDQLISDVFISAEDQMYREKLTESQSMRNKTIQVIIKALNEKSAREKVHSDQVAHLCQEMGKAMNLGAQTLNELVTAGHLHDIGKIAIRDEVLNKSDRLTEQEYEEVKKHSESGYLILKSVDTYSSLAEDILSHHERWDGQGYPRGLKGTEIPLIARIISVTDAYEAMTSQRLYKATFNHKEARAELRKHAGTQFDPEIVNIFLDHNIGL